MHLQAAIHTLFCSYISKKHRRLRDDLQLLRTTLEERITDTYLLVYPQYVLTNLPLKNAGNAVVSITVRSYRPDATIIHFCTHLHSIIMQVPTHK